MWTIWFVEESKEFISSCLSGYGLWFSFLSRFTRMVNFSLPPPQPLSGPCGIGKCPQDWNIRKRSAHFPRCLLYLFVLSCSLVVLHYFVDSMIPSSRFFLNVLSSFLNNSQKIGLCKLFNPPLAEVQVGIFQSIFTLYLNLQALIFGMGSWKHVVFITLNLIMPKYRGKWTQLPKITSIPFVRTTWPATLCAHMFKSHLTRKKIMWNTYLTCKQGNYDMDLSFFQKTEVYSSC